MRTPEPPFWRDWLALVITVVTLVVALGLVFTVVRVLGLR
jgi:hypothetical protein